jgi:hypothetical protein
MSAACRIELNSVHGGQHIINDFDKPSLEKERKKPKILSVKKSGHLSDTLLCPRSSFEAAQDPSNNEQNQNHGNGKRMILKYAHWHFRQRLKSADLRGAARV